MVRAADTYAEASHASPMRDGAVAQLGERYNGIVEVVGSIPIGSTIFVVLTRGRAT